MNKKDILKAFAYFTCGFGLYVAAKRVENRLNEQVADLAVKAYLNR